MDMIPLTPLYMYEGFKKTLLLLIRRTIVIKDTAETDECQTDNFVL